MPYFNYHLVEESQGTKVDLVPIQDEKWLGNSVVGYLIEAVTAETWRISLLFVSAETPLKFVVHKLEPLASAEKVQYYEKLAFKTATVLRHAFTPHLN